MLIDRMKEDFPDSNILEEEPLSNYSYTKTGGKADILIFPKTKEEAIALVRWIANEDIELTILGNASNLIVRDGGIRGVTLVLTDMDQIKVQGTTITAESGSKIIDVSYMGLTHSLTGLEFACGIPGSTGGAVYMNAGAYGGEVEEVITQVTVLTRQGEVKTLTNEQMKFSYRNSILQETLDIVLEVTFSLEAGNPKEIKEEMDELTDLRRSKQPLDLPSCGSVFKRPEGYFTGKLIQDAGLQGYQHGGAQISKKHAGFIVNVDQATATDYIELIEFIQKEIYRIYKVNLETEVRIIGEDII